MKKAALFLALLFAIVLTSITPLISGISGSLYGALDGRYLWRGQVLSDTPVMQPGLSVGLNKFTLDWWGSYTFGTGELTESDYRVSFTDAIPFIPLISASSGFWIYTHPSAIYTSNELFGTLNADVPGRPYLSFYYDPVSGKGGYAELGASQELSLLGVGVNGALNAGYNFGEDGCSRSFTAIAATLGLSYTVAGIKINPSFNGQYSLDKQYKSLGTWSLNISYGFGIDEDTKASVSE